MSNPEKPKKTPAAIDSGNPISLRSAAFRSGFSVATLRRHIHEGTLAATKTAGRYEVAIADLDALPAKLQQIREEREKAERAEMEAPVKKIVDGAPPLSEDQKNELRALFGGRRPPIIPVTQSMIHPRPEQPDHLHCGVCGKTWNVPALEAHLTYAEAVEHGGKEHPEVDALLNVKPGKGKP